MREVLVQIARRLGEVPDGLSSWSCEVASETGSNGGKRWPNEAARNAEARRRLHADPAYLAAMAEADRLRQELRAVDAQIEQVNRRHRSDCRVPYLVASLLGAGLRAEAEAVLAAYGVEPGAWQEPKAESEAEPQA